MDTPAQVIPQEGQTDEWAKYSPTYRAVADYLRINVDTEWNQFKPRLDYFVNWAKGESKSENPDDILLAITQLEDKYGKPSWDDRKVNHLYRHLKIESLKKKRFGELEEKKQLKEKPVRDDYGKELQSEVEKARSSLEHLEARKSATYLKLKSAMEKLRSWKDGKVEI